MSQETYCYNIVTESLFLLCWVDIMSPDDPELKSQSLLEEEKGQSSCVEMTDDTWCKCGLSRENTCCTSLYTSLLEYARSWLFISDLVCDWLELICRFNATLESRFETEVNILLMRLDEVLLDISCTHRVAWIVVSQLYDKSRLLEPPYYVYHNVGFLVRPSSDIM